MKQKLDSLLEELNGIDLVLEKLESKTNVSVFEKLCSNCDRVFSSFCEFDVREIVNQGLGKSAINFLNRLKGQVIRLKNYKEALIEYINMTERETMSNNLPSNDALQSQANKINQEVGKNKYLTLQNEEVKAA